MQGVGWAVGHDWQLSLSVSRKPFGILLLHVLPQPNPGILSSKKSGGGEHV